MQPSFEPETAAAVAAVLSNPVRLRLVERLLAGPCIVGDLVEATGLGQAVVSKQLGLLRAAGLLACAPQGRCREYRLASPGDAAALVAALGGLAKACAANLRDCPKQAVRSPRTDEKRIRQ